MLSPIDLICSPTPRNFPSTSVLIWFRLPDLPLCCYLSYCVLNGKLATGIIEKYRKYTIIDPVNSSVNLLTFSGFNKSFIVLWFVVGISS
ncbi:hypothetical protein PHET_06805 [Paragonimus heterotremus]|uniref:Uncharacterized protein n=1 Tax=Paragonimus heterotremus TaxID=100268 RepID=A0A8J4T7Z6_9TREM|nr:hypothetical protein PHET_06805 [Paragonimus heterotremus]